MIARLCTGSSPSNLILWPRRDHLLRASEELTNMFESQGVWRWKVEANIVRPRSTILRLRASCKSHDLRLTYKVDRVDGALPDEEIEESLRRSRRFLESESWFAKQLFEFCRFSSLRFNIPVLVDIESLTAMRLHVPGRPLRRPYYYLTSGKWRKLCSVYRSIGFFLRGIAVVGASDFPARARVSIGERLDMYWMRARPHMGLQDRRFLEVAYEDLRDILDNDLSYCHGDVSRSNILVGARGIGLIDFDWSLHLPFRDVVHFAFRTRNNSAWLPRSMRDELFYSLCVGFGTDPSDEPLVWRAAFLEQVLRSIWIQDTESAAWGMSMLASEAPMQVKGLSGQSRAG